MKNSLKIIVLFILAVSLQADWRTSSTNETPSGANFMNYFGYSVSLGLQYKAIGAPGENAVYVYKKDGEGWSTLGKIESSNADVNCDFIFSSCYISSFGYSMAFAGGDIFNSNPNLLVIGAPRSRIEFHNPVTHDTDRTDTGAFCTYTITGDTITQLGECTMGRVNGNLGYSIDVSNYSNFGFVGIPPRPITYSHAKLVVGNPEKEVNDNYNQGEVEFYDFNGTAWDSKTTQTAQTDEVNAQFGYSVAIYKDKVAIGAPNATAPNGKGLVSIHNANGAWQETISIPYSQIFSIDKYGKSVDIHNNSLIIGYDVDYAMFGSLQGAARIYDYNSTSTSWEHQSYLPNTTDAIADGFATSVSINDNYAIVGAPTNTYTKNGTYFNGGGVFIYEKDESGTWSNVAELNGEDTSRFGQSVSLYSSDFMVGASETEEVYNYEYYEPVKTNPAVIMYLLN